MTSNRKKAKRHLRWSRYTDRLDKVCGAMPCPCGEECHSIPRGKYPPGYIARRAITRRRDARTTRWRLQYTAMRVPTPVDVIIDMVAKWDH